MKVPYGRLSKSEEWIDYLLMELEVYEYFEKSDKCTIPFVDREVGKRFFLPEGPNAI